MTLLISTRSFICYSLVYTIYVQWSTPQNIVIVGLPGASPPLPGWTAATKKIALPPLTLVLIFRLWTPPQVWPLAYDRIAEYRKEGVPRMAFAKGVSRTKNQMVVYAFLVRAASLAPYSSVLTGLCYLFATTGLNIYRPNLFVA